MIAIQRYRWEIGKMIFVNCQQKILQAFLLLLNCFWLCLYWLLNASPIFAEAFLFYQSKENYRLAEDDMYDKSGMSLLQSSTKCYRLLIEPCILTIANNLLRNIGDKWQKERRDADYMLPPLLQKYDRHLNFHWIFNGKSYFVNKRTRSKGFR